MSPGFEPLWDSELSVLAMPLRSSRPPLFSVDSGAMSYGANGSDKGGWNGMTRVVAAPSAAGRLNPKFLSAVHRGNGNEPATEQDVPYPSVTTRSCK